MKKLNRKGFTLVELLAVIIILAIVVGISIPAITNIINDSKNNALGVAVDAAEKYLSDQYSFMQLDATNVQDEFSDWLNSTTLTTYDATNKKYTSTLTSNDTTKPIIEAMGFNAEDVTTVKVEVYEAGGACVKVTRVPKSSQYFSTEYWTADTDDGYKSSTKYQSKGC